jgi:hypothetical protein
VKCGSRVYCWRPLIAEFDRGVEPCTTDVLGPAVGWPDARGRADNRPVRRPPATGDRSALRESITLLRGALAAELERHVRFRAVVTLASGLLAAHTLDGDEAVLDEVARLTRDLVDSANARWR